jgi:hypothetical protein
MLAPVAEAQTAYRRIPAPGNVQLGITVTVALQPGTYDWAEQAVDTAWAGGPFSGLRRISTVASPPAPVTPPPTPPVTAAPIVIPTRTPIGDSVLDRVDAGG